MLTVEKSSINTEKPRVNLRSVALPAEHGGWGFLLEPIVLGLLLAPSLMGLLLSLAMLAAFLVHQPLKISIKDLRVGKRTPRTRYALRFAAGYGLAAVFLLAVVIVNSDSHFLLPLLVALPFMMVQLLYDAGNKSRDLIPELAGSSALGAIAAAVVLLDGWAMTAALLLWVILLARTIPSILYVRARLRLERAKPFSPIPSAVSHLAALVLMVLLAASNQIPWSVVLAMSILLARALHGLSAYRRPAARPAIIGIQEIIFGLLTIVIVALGY